MRMSAVLPRTNHAISPDFYLKKSTANVPITMVVYINNLGLWVENNFT